MIFLELSTFRRCFLFKRTIFYTLVIILKVTGNLNENTVTIGSKVYKTKIEFTAESKGY